MSSPVLFLFLPPFSETIHQRRERSTKQNEQPLINPARPQGQVSVHRLISADEKKKGKHFNLLAVTMPAAPAGTRHL